MTRNPSPESSLDLMKEIQQRVPTLEIRKEQIEALDALQENEAAGNTAGLIAMAPGIGKTVVMAADTRRRLLKSPKGKGLFLCDSNYILGEARETFQSIVGEEFHCRHYDSRIGAVPGYSVVFDSFQAMRRHRQVFPPRTFGFGIVDEGHHSKAPTYEPTLEYFRFGHLLGATATPDRRDELDVRDIFGPECYTYSLARGLAERRLASVEYHVIADAIVETGIIKDTEGYQYTKKDFNRVVFAPRRDEEIVRIAQEYAQTIKGDVKRAVFCKSIEQAEMFAQLFTENGDETLAFHSKLGKRAQKKAYRAFKEGELSGLCTVAMFDEGIDIPEVNQVLMERDTETKRIYLQELGRGLRRTPKKKRVQVLDFVNNAGRLLLIDRVWRDIAQYADQEGGIEEGIFEIDLNSIHFKESTLNALKLLRTIDKKIYRPDQAVPSGSYLGSRLARELDLTRPALMAIAKTLQIVPETFPTQRGSKTPYFLAEDVERIKLASANLFPS